MQDMQIDFVEMQEATDNFADNSILGKGSFSFVHKGVLSTSTARKLHITPGKAVAIKAMKKLSPMQCLSLGITKKTLERQLANERVTLAALSHPNVCKLFGFSLNGPFECFCYEICGGGDLLNRLSCKNNIPPLIALHRVQLATEIARGLTYLHTEASPSLVHRDIKSANILLTEEGNAKIADFGTVVDADYLYSSEVSNKDAIGTPAYMPPEYKKHGSVTLKMDAFAFGVILLEILTGLNPGEHNIEKIVRVGHSNSMDSSASGSQELGLESGASNSDYLDQRAGLWVGDSARQLASLALQSIDPDPNARLAAHQCLPQLETLLKALSGGEAAKSRACMHCGWSVFDHESVFCPNCGKHVSKCSSDLANNLKEPLLPMSIEDHERNHQHQTCCGCNIL